MLSLLARAHSQRIHLERVHRCMSCYNTGIIGLASQACSRLEQHRTVSSANKSERCVVAAHAWTRGHLLSNPVVFLFQRGSRGRRWLGIGRFGCVAHLLSHAVSKHPCAGLPGSRHWSNRTSERILTHMAQTRHLRHGPSTFAHGRRHEPRIEDELHAIVTICSSTQNVLIRMSLFFFFENIILDCLSCLLLTCEHNPKTPSNSEKVLHSCKKPWKSK